AAAPSMLGTAIVEANLDDVALRIDGRLVGVVSRDKPLTVPGLPSGLHEFEGVKAGYQPDRKDVLIAPGQETAVTLRIRYVRQINKPAADLNEQGERLLFSFRSSTSVANLVPMERKQTDADLKEAATLFERALKNDSGY